MSRVITIVIGSAASAVTRAAGSPCAKKAIISAPLRSPDAGVA
jgi:hypothetical protein